VLVHDMEEKRKDLLREEASRFGASDAPLTMDAHQYVALAHGLAFLVCCIFSVNSSLCGEVSLLGT
jgi:hypothetical protein